MPHLQFEFNRPLADEDRERLADWTTIEYSEAMETGIGHVAVSIREQSSHALSLGRATNGDPVAVLNADIREGRTVEQRERFATAVIAHLAHQLNIPQEHCYVVYTEHPGEDFVLAEGTLGSWSDEELDSGALD